MKWKLLIFVWFLHCKQIIWRGRTRGLDGALGTPLFGESAPRAKKYSAVHKCPVHGKRVPPETCVWFVLVLWKMFHCTGKLCFTRYWPILSSYKVAHEKQTQGLLIICRTKGRCKDRQQCHPEFLLSILLLFSVYLQRKQILIPFQKHPLQTYCNQYT